MNRLLRGVILSFILIAPALSQVTARECGHSTVNDFSPGLVPKANAFLVSLKAAVRAQDKQKVAGMIRYPLLINMPKSHKQIRTIAEFIAEYDRLFTTSVRKAVEEQRPECLFENWQGVMIGNGEIWFEELPKSGMKIKALNIP